MWVIVGLGAAGSIASIVSLLASAGEKRIRLVHGGYLVFIILLSGLSVWSIEQTAEAKREHNRDVRQRNEMERRASHLLSTFDENAAPGGNVGFMNSALAFMEDHKDRFPDAYVSARQLCENAGFQLDGTDGRDLNFEEEWKLGRGAAAMAKVLEGLGSGAFAEKGQVPD